MANYRNAPKLIHNGSKSEGLFYQLPQKMVEHIFQNFDGKCGNQIKLLIVMLGNKGDGAFRFSEKWITQHTGMSKSNYHRAMESLIEKNYVIRENGKLILNLPLLMEDAHDEQEGTHHDDDGTHDDKKSNHSRMGRKQPLQNAEKLFKDTEKKRTNQRLKKVKPIIQKIKVKEGFFNCFSMENVEKVTFQIGKMCIFIQNNPWYIRKIQQSKLQAKQAASLSGGAKRIPAPAERSKASRHPPSLRCGVTSQLGVYHTAK